MANKQHQQLKATVNSQHCETHTPMKETGSSTADTASAQRGQRSCSTGTAPVFLRCKEAAWCTKAKPPSVSAGSNRTGQLCSSHLDRKHVLQSKTASPVPAHVESLPNDYSEKRKRGNESSQRLLKRVRCSASVEAVSDSERLLSMGENPSVTNQFKSNKLSRSHRLQKKVEAVPDCVNDPKPECEWTSRAEKEIQESNDVRKGSYDEDSLWTDQYSPQHAGEVIGNSSAVNRLHGWLKKWKVRADRDERRLVEERKREKSSYDCWDCGDFQGEPLSEEDIDGRLFNTLLITGPVGVGKTASVYACAQQLGFKVFEVNCSSQRSGHLVLSQLKEATQSHLVETAEKELLKPCFISNYNTSSCTVKAHSAPGNVVLPKKVTSTSKKRSSQSLNKLKVTPAAGSLVHFFKTKAKADHFHCGGLESSLTSDCGPSHDRAVTASPHKRAAISLILFEEVDLIFDEDVGFLAAIKTFMATTKRPVVLTTNDPYFKERFDSRLEEITFKSPSRARVCSFLQRVLLAERVHVDSEDINSLLTLTRGDVRRCLLQLQLWLGAHGAHGGFDRGDNSQGVSTTPAVIQHCGSEESLKEVLLVLDLNATDEDSSASPLVSCCSTAMLGLHPVTVHHLLNFLKCEFWSGTDPAELLTLLAESWRSHVPLLYSNFKLLLDAGIFSAVHRISNLQQMKQPMASRMSSSKSVMKVSRLSRKKNITSPSFNLIHELSGMRTSSTITTALRGLASQDKANDKTDQIVGECLDAMADFFDLMSYLDVMQPGDHKVEEFLWTGAELKDGMLDEMSQEEDGMSWNQERMQLDILAAVEGFGCHRCWWRVCEAWMETQNYRPTLEDQTWRCLVERLGLAASSITSKRNISLGLNPLCTLRICQRRSKFIKEVLSSKAFSLMGNRRAVCIDYLPVLRFICCSQTQELCRPLTYLSSSQFGLSKSVMEWFTEDFSH
ncbi:ATPase family AAA domain-containing protein 5b [Gouania willdenowi]|uniref:ATPase family AAA domain-containing protein 5b n=1 Tax=Gouania willdenowi TaxID=441366 RepID=UPI0010559891|nr:ATPase family AAA domain-containing protein 5-like [Gouania willdenowi]